MSTYTYTCPLCSGHRFNVSCIAVLGITDLGVGEPRVDGVKDFEYGGEESADCRDCDWGGLLEQAKAPSTSWSTICERYGLDTSFQYGSKAMAAYARLYAQEQEQPK